jgi:hypothetical protein
MTVGDDTDEFLADLAAVGTRVGLHPRFEADRIPRIVHMIWLEGDRSFGPTHYLAVRTAYHVHRPERILLFTDREPVGSEWWSRAKAFATVLLVRPPTMVNGHLIPWPHHRADLMRILILHAFGGIYLDLDVISLQTVEGLLEHRVVMAREGDKGLGSCVILARPGERFLEEWISEYKTRYGETDDWWVGLSVRAPLALAAHHPEVVILPQGAFMPFLYDDLRLFTERDLSAELRGSYTVHLWETEASKTPLFPVDIDYFRTHDNALTTWCRCYVEEFLSAPRRQSGGFQLGPETLRRGTRPAAIACITLASRPDRRQRMKGLLVDHPVHFHLAEPHPNPARGCLESHLEVIEWARSERHEAVLILEDDIDVVRDLASLPPFPLDWDMVYLGGLCTQIYEGPRPGTVWVRGDVYCNHAYVIREELYADVLAEGWNYPGPSIDHFFVHRIHPRRRAYVPIDPFIVQLPGWSDVAGRPKWHNFKWPRVGERFFPP